MKAQTYTILSIVLIIIVSIFAVLNVGAVEVNYFFGKGDLPLILVILFSVLMGGLITTGSGLVRFVRLQRQNKLLKAENKQLQNKLAECGVSLPEPENDENQKYE
ncbi:lipopolysaccharide assembly protein LapA domain-containing protein [Aciduricibacillus chroicocephali]|uniref:Lipopolysaccharide assembly protein LapA domain-containing protein n=1 Tax=Aciduricibacillus chroicocephali TaxID=3054939 RepID=A0ABY9KS62_9BACI|nr:lipopolysaccharide assembly protein LapA domain-containing protein [Bacillaceae bacterium 44XB]